MSIPNQKVAAPWVLSILASLYWRIVGKPRLALDCLQLALDDVPKEFRDVPFVSIASLHHKVGLIDDAIRITNEALEINTVEVRTQNMFKCIKGAFLHYINNISMILKKKTILFLFIYWIRKNYLIIIDIYTYIFFSQ